MNNQLSIFSFVSLLLCASILGCVSTAPTPQDHFYRLMLLETPQEHEIPPIKGTLKVERVRSFNIFRERAILYTYAHSPEVIKQHHYHHWIASAPSLIHKHIVSYLRESKIADLVVDERYSDQSNYRLLLELNNFERILHDSGTITVSVGITAELVSDNKSKPVFIKHLNVEKTTTDASIPASVKAINEGLLDLYRQLSDKLAALTPITYEPDAKYSKYAD